MIRKIIKIDEDKCDGCGLCEAACHEGAIGIFDGKAKLVRDDYCDGLGDCLPACPTGAIAFEEREAAGYDEAAAAAGMENKKPETLACGCPGTHSKPLERDTCPEDNKKQAPPLQTHLNQWPVQIKLVPQNAPYFKRANLLVAADCAAYAYGNFHAEFMKNRITIIGCPKLDEGDYSVKLTAILKENDIKSVTIARMEVPCCGGIENAAKTALQNCGKMIPWQVVTFTTDGDIMEI
ncbi:MAG: 4Fe-4S binding protein [Oscillospiraceae bacterium]|nr:4Fe-4S binding protein [Oscillospiraceae bacterium]